MASLFRFTLLVVVLALVFPYATACCKRKPNFGCCGKGPCNIFCCNCDHGCNQQCEATHCNTVEWIKCAAVVTGCAGACKVTAGAACAKCMGKLYSTCKKCYSVTETEPTPGELVGHKSCMAKLASCETQCLLGSDDCIACFGQTYEVCKEVLRPGDEKLVWSPAGQVLWAEKEASSKTVQALAV